MDMGIWDAAWLVSHNFELVSTDWERLIMLDEAKAENVGLGARNVRGGKVVGWISQGLFLGLLKSSSKYYYTYDRALLSGGGISCHDLFFYVVA